MSSVTQPKANEICTACDGALLRVDIPKHDLWSCEACGALYQRSGQELVKLDQLLQRNDLGDDRARSAVSTPHVTSVKSFLEVFDMAHRSLELNLAEARGGLRTVLAQAENRLDYAVARLAGMALASDEVNEALEAIRETRELISPLSGKHRGIAVKETHAAATSPSE